MKTFNEFANNSQKEDNVKKIIVDTRNHQALYGKDTTHYAGYYIVDGIEFDDEGNTDRGDSKLFDVLETIARKLDLSEDLQDDAMGIQEIIQDQTGKIIDSDQCIFEITKVDTPDEIEVKIIEK